MSYMPPFRCGEEIKWPEGSGQVTTFRGPNADGLYVVTVQSLDLFNRFTATIYSPGKHARASQNKEVHRYV